MYDKTALTLLAIIGVMVFVAGVEAQITTITEYNISAENITGWDYFCNATDSCYSIDDFLFDTDTDTTIPDTNASTECANGEFLNGDGSCDAGYLDADGVDSAYNASYQWWLYPWLRSMWRNITADFGEGSNSYVYPNNTYGNNLLIQGHGIFQTGVIAGGVTSNNMSTSDGDIWFINSSGGPMSVMYDNGNFTALGKICGIDGCAGITYNATYDANIDTDTNASTECANGEFLNGDGSCDAGFLDADGVDSTYNITYENTYNASYDAELGLMFNISYEYWDNASLISTYNATYDAMIGWGDVPLCTGNDKLTSSDGISFTCDTDQLGGGSGGVNYWMTIGGNSFMWPNATAGGKVNINITTLNVTDINLVDSMPLGCGNITGGSDGDYCADSAFNLTYESTFNITYESTYNASYDAELGLMFNISYEYWDNASLISTYNATYDAYVDTDTDTNASTECAGTTTYLDGEGNCDDISSVYEAEAHCDEHDGAYLDCNGEELDVNAVDVCNYCSFIDTDTNASTECGAGEFLNGDGSCDAGYLDADGVDSAYNITYENTHNATYDAKVDRAGDTMTGALFMNNINITINATYGLCLNIACTRYIYDNGTGVVIQG